MKEASNYVKIINFKVKVENKVNIITTTISGIKRWMKQKTKLSIQTQMEIMELAEKILDRLLDRRVKLNDTLITSK